MNTTSVLANTVGTEMVKEAILTKITANPEYHGRERNLVQVCKLNRPSFSRQGLMISDGTKEIRAVVSTSVNIEDFDILNVKKFRLVKIKNDFALLIDKFTIECGNLHVRFAQDMGLFKVIRPNRPLPTKSINRSNKEDKNNPGHKGNPSNPRPNGDNPVTSRDNPGPTNPPTTSYDRYVFLVNTLGTKRMDEKHDHSDNKRVITVDKRLGDKSKTNRKK